MPELGAAELSRIYRQDDEALAGRRRHRLEAGDFGRIAGGGAAAQCEHERRSGKDEISVHG
jgi:hypothetical protein